MSSTRRFLLIQSPSMRGEMVLPLGLSYLGTVLLENGHSVKILDLNSYKDPFNKLKNELQSEVPDYVCVSLRNIDTANYTCGGKTFLSSFYKVIEITKNHSNAIIIVGGTGFSLFPEEIMKAAKGIDYGIYLEGEETLIELTNNTNLNNIKGLFFRDANKIIFTGKRSTSNFIVKVPRKDISGLEDNLSKYSEITSIGVITKKGCSLRCIYCNYPYLSGRDIKIREINDIFDEIETLYYKYNIKKFFFADPVFNNPIWHAKLICKEIIKRKLDIEWGAYFKVDLIDLELAELLKKSGCKDIEFSPDTGAGKIMDIMKKDMKPSDIFKSYKLLKDVGAKLEFNFLINAPGENLITVLETYIVILKLVIKGLIKNGGRFSINKIRIYPHTEIYEMAINKKIMSPKSNLLEPIFYSPAGYVDFMSSILSGLFNFFHLRKK